jgi:hypothetical protein
MPERLGFESDPTAKYDMPTVFGPTEMPDVSKWGHVEMLSTSFVTTLEAVRPFVPSVFDVPSEPIVTVSRMTYADVDYLGGRGYNEVTVGIATSYPFGDASQRGSFMPVVWVDDSRAIIVGREYMGYAKLGAELAPVERTVGSGRSYHVMEYGTPLLRGEITDMVELTGDAFAAVRRASDDVSVFAWKHIAGPGGTVDADYPTSVKLHFDWTEAFRGAGSSTFFAPAWQDAPHSARVLAALHALPVVRHRPALFATGTGSIDRTAVARLSVPSVVPA